MVVHIFSQVNVNVFSNIVWKPLELNSLQNLRPISYLHYLCLASFPGWVLQPTFALNSMRNVQPACASKRTVTDSCRVTLSHIGTDVSA